jgi:hypothetical protein
MFFFLTPLLVQPSKAKPYPHHFTFHTARLTPPLLGSFHTFSFSLPPSLFFSLHCLDSSQAQPHSFTFGSDVLTSSHSRLHVAFTSGFTVHTHGFTPSKVQRFRRSMLCLFEFSVCELGSPRFGACWL